MKITLTEAKTIKAKDYDVGDEVVVNKKEGERLISEGVANRVIEETENRVVEIPENRTRGLPSARLFSGHKVFGR